MDEVVAEITELLERLDRKVAELAAAVSSALRGVPDLLTWVVERVEDGWDEFMRRFREVMLWIGDKLLYAGDPGELTETRDAWHAEVAAVTSALAERLDAGDLRTDDAWDGAAAEQYRQKVPEQQAAIRAIRDEFTAGITAALDQVRDGIVVFWCGAGAALAALVAGIIGAITATGTIVGLPTAPVLAAAAVLTALASLGGTLAVLTSQASSAESTLNGVGSSGLTAWPSFALS
ncbi:MAG: hypothetical protein IE923_18150 [Micrococcales bacterium]|nr:hypothetical protein [Micrococcales bacterium]